MNPLDASSPAELFGEDALGDLRLLKRRYAKLIRQHSPEEAPEAFAHIRRLFERARGSVDRAAAPKPSPSLVGAHLLRAESFDQDLAALQELAEGGDLVAVNMVFAALEATHPQGALPWLVRVGARPALAHRVAALLNFMLANGLLHGQEPELLTLSEEMTEPFALSRLTAQRALTLARRGDPAAALHILDRWAPRVRSMSPDAERPLFRVASWEACWAMSEPRLERQLERLDDVGLPLSDQEYDLLAQHLTSALAWRRAHRDPEVPAAVLEALARGRNRGAVHDWAALRALQLRCPELDKPLLYLTDHHPALRRMLHNMEQRITHQDSLLVSWQEQGEPPDSPLWDLEGAVAKIARGQGPMPVDPNTQRDVAREQLQLRDPPLLIGGVFSWLLVFSLGLVVMKGSALQILCMPLVTLLVFWATTRSQGSLLTGKDLHQRSILVGVMGGTLLAMVTPLLKRSGPGFEVVWLSIPALLCTMAAAYQAMSWKVRGQERAFANAHAAWMESTNQRLEKLLVASGVGPHELAAEAARQELPGVLGRLEEMMRRPLVSRSPLSDAHLRVAVEYELLASRLRPRQQRL